MNGFVCKQANTSDTYHPHKRSVSIARLLAVLAVGLCALPAFADGVPLRPGDVLVSISSGSGYNWNNYIEHFSPNGVLLDTFNYGYNNTEWGTLGFDGSNTLYIPIWNGGDDVQTINSSGITGTFGSGYELPMAEASDNNGYVYIGQISTVVGDPGSILKFDSNGNQVASYSIPIDPNSGFSIVSMALADDQCTMRYVSQDEAIHQFNVCTNTPLADLVTSLPGPSFTETGSNVAVIDQIRQLPNGNLLVGSEGWAYLLSNTGAIIGQYESPQSLFSVYPDPDKHTFWATGFGTDSSGTDFSNRIYRINMQTGAVLTTISVPTGFTLESLSVVPGNPDAKELGKSCNCIGDPINSATGNEYKDDEDIALDALSFHRYYNSQTSVAPAHMGADWRHTFDRSIEYVPSSGLTIATAFRSDGRELNFTLTSGQWVADPDVADRLTAQTNASGAITGWTYFDATTRDQESYDQNGNLLSITDTNGLVTTLTYSTASTPTSVAPAAGLLVTVTDPRGRTLNFTYNSNSTVATITEPDSGVVTYGYDGNGNLTSVTYPDKTSRQYVYNESTLTSSANLPAALTGDIDETNTRFTSVSYNTQGKATMSMLASNIAETQVAYNADGTTTVTYPTGSQSTLTFNQQYGSFHRTTASAPCGVQCDQPYASSTYDPNGYLASATDFNGNVAKTTYDTNGLLDQQIDASGTPNQRTTTLTWNTMLRVPLTRTVLDASTNTTSSTEWVYNGIGQALARCDIDPNNSAASGYTCNNTGTVPAGVRRSTYTYCTTVGTGCPIVGLMLTATGPRTDLTQTTTYSYYSSSSASSCGTPGGACYMLGDLYQIADALGHVITIASYDADGRPTRITDSNGVNTDMTYTPRGWLASRTVGGAATTFTYTPYGAVQTITDPDGVITTYGYDTAHRLNKITDALGNYIQYTLDAAGDKTSERVYDTSGTLHKQLSRTFNTLGQLTTVVDGLGKTVFNASTAGNYDANGNLIQSSDALGIKRQLGYDALNRLVQTIDDYNGTDSLTPNTASSTTYDSLDRVTEVMDPSNLNTTYQYDGLSDATGQISPDTGSTSRTFDAAGDVLTSTDAKGIVITSVYDALNRKTSVSYADATQNVSYAYDEANSVTGCSSSSPIGRLTRIIENTVTTVFCYDTRGNVITKQQITSAATDSTVYTYTSANRLSGITYPSGSQVAYTLDGDGRIQAINLTPKGGTAAAAVSSVTYEPFGPVLSYILGNGQSITRSYDANYRFTDISSAGFNLHVARDAMGDVIALGNAAGANPATETYAYDPLYRLTTVTEASGTVLDALTYNGTGDRLSKTGSGLDTGTYGYNPNTHQLIATGNLARTVDANGNTTAITQAAATYGFGYSDRNRMIVAQASGTTVGTYTYNALGERVGKVAASTVRFNYDENTHLVGEYGSYTRDYVWLGDIPVAVVDIGVSSSSPAPTCFSCIPYSGGPIGSIPKNGSGSSGTTTTAVNYVYADGLGAPRAVANSAGTVIWQWTYQGNPFGEQAPTSSGSYALNLRYPGQYLDQETGLNYNVNRDYDSNTGRYVQSDPIGLRGGISTYVYVGGDPLDRTDPFGLINYVMQWGGAGYMGVGGEGAVGAYITTSTTFPYVDAGVYVTGGGGGGQLIGSGLEGGLIKGNESDIEGVTMNAEGAIAPVGGEVMFADGKPVGFVVGPAAEEGVAVSATRTWAWGLNDLGNWLGGKIYDHYHPFNPNSKLSQLCY